MNTKVIKFYTKDNIELNGIIYQNGKTSNKVLIQIHGMTSNCFKNRNYCIAKK